MKNMVFVVLLAIGLSACVGIPEPQDSGDALLIGTVALDFPDGFLGRPARTVQANLLLYFRDITRNRNFCFFTSDGYFYFHARASDEFELERYEYSALESDGEYYLNDRIAQRFAAVPGKLVNVGQLTVRYEKPRISNRVSFAKVTTHADYEDFSVLADDGFPLIHRSQQTYWQYERVIDQRWDEEALITYLKRKNPRSSWLQAEITR